LHSFARLLKHSFVIKLNYYNAIKHFLKKMLLETINFLMKQLYVIIYNLLRAVFIAFIKSDALVVAKYIQPSKQAVKAICIAAVVKPTYKKNIASSKHCFLWAAHVPPFSLNKLSLTKIVQTLNLKTLTNVIYLKNNLIPIERLIYDKASNTTNHYKPKPRLVYC